MSYYGLLPPSEGFPRARAAAQRALEIDPSLPEAHATVALERLFWGWDWKGAGEAYERAMKLDPNLPLVLVMYSLYLTTCGRHEEALTMALRARKLDPLSPFVGMGVGWANHFAGRQDAVVREMSELLTLYPGLIEAGSALVAAYNDLGRHEEAIAVMAKQPCWGLTYDADALLKAFRSGGAKAFYREQLDQMHRMTNLPVSASFALAVAHLHLGEVDRALDQVERMIDAHIGGVVFLGVDPCLSTLRGNSRYEALLTRAGVPRPQTASTPRTAST